MKHHYFKSLLTILFLMVGAKALAANVYIDGVYYILFHFLDIAHAEVISDPKYSSNKYSGNVVIPASVTYKGVTYSVTSIGDSAFDGCSGLTSITIPESVTSIGKSAFSGCSGLTSINIPESVTSIGKSAFWGCSGLTSINIPEGVTSIGESAFRGCSGLTSITIPESVTNIGDYAFEGCWGLTSITVASGNTFYDSRNNCNAIIETSSNTLIAGCQNTIIPNSVTSIGNSAFYGCSSLTSVIIPEGVTSIGNSAFYGCSGLTSINIPEGVTSIGNYAFDGCRGLTSINIPEGVTSIGNSAFYGCSSLTSVTIPESVTRIGNGAFSGCSSLTSVTIPESVTSIGESAFSGCSGLAVVCNRMVPPTIQWNSFSDGTNVIVPNEAVNRYRTTQYWDKLSVNIPIIFVNNSQTTITLRKADPFSDVSVSIGDSTYTFSQSNTLKIGGLSPGKEYTITAYGTFNDTMLGGTITAETRTVKPEIRIDNTTNVTATLTGVEFAGDAVVVECGFEGFEPGKTITVSGLKPGNTYTYSFYVVCSEGSRFTASQSVTTVPITLSASAKPGITSSLLTGSYSVIDATITESGFRGIDKQDHVLIAGLDPKTSYTRYYYVRTAEGWEFDRAVSFTTEGLRLVTEQPKVISEGNVIVAAESNIYDEETNVGFEWRRTDWTDDFASNTGGAYIYEGTMEGYIRNLNANYLWKFRPYYLSNSGKYYYGDWVGIDPSNTSYFEPTVHTYSKIQIQGNTALVKGYALRGTDNVVVQGFKYWKTVAGAKAANYAPNRIAVPNDAKTVEATGLVMTANLKDLDYDTEYCYVAFVTTSEGETFYGEQQTFVTEADLTPVEDLKAEHAPASIIARYDVQGRRLNKPIRGINIILMSDGTTRKVVVK